MQGDRVLMVLRERSGKVRWELPSGLLELGESFETAAARETLEETGVEVDVGQLLCTVVMDVPEEGYRGVNVYFRAVSKGSGAPNPRSTDEPIQRAEYVDTSHTRAGDIHPVDRRILSHFVRKPDGKPFYFRICL